MRRLFMTVAAILATVTTAACVRTAEAADGSFTTRVVQSTDSTVTVVTRFTPRKDALGAVERHDITYRAPRLSVLVDRYVPMPRTTDSLFNVRRPLPGDTATLDVCVVAVRRGTSSQKQCVAFKVPAMKDAPPPAPDSLRVDTLAVRVDSVQVKALTFAGVEMAKTGPFVSLVEGDSVLLVAIGWKSGVPLRQATFWSAGDEFVKVVPINRGLNDTALVVALSCQCRESGQLNNPPTLVPTGSGMRYSVRDAQGDWRPVTPLSTE